MADTLSSLLSSPSRHPALCGSITYLTGAVVPFSPDQAMACSVSEGAQSGFLLGGAFSAACSLTLNNQEEIFTLGKDPYGAQVRVNMRIGEIETPLCVFTVSRVIRRSRDPRLTLTGSDALGTAFEAAFQDPFTYPLTLGQLADGLSSLAGFTRTGALPDESVIISQRPDWGDISLRQALAYTACAAGCFVRIDREGKLRFSPVRPSAAPFSIGPAVTLQKEYGDQRFGPLTGIKIQCAGGPRDAAPLIVQTDDTPLTAYNSLTVNGNPLFPYGGAHTQALANSLLSALSGLTLRQMKITWRGDPTLSLGDPVRVTDPGGTFADTLITRQSLTFSRGFSMQSDCLPPVDLPAVGRVFTSAGALNAGMLRGAIDGVLIRDGTLAAQALAAGSVTAAQLAAGAVTAEKLSAGAVTSGHLSASALQAVDAQIGAADIGFGQIKDLVTGSALITRGVGDQLYIKRLAVDSAQMVDLTVGQFTVRADDGNYYSLRVDLDTGCVTARETAVTDGEIAAGITDSGQHILLTDLTVSELNTASAAATEALIGRLTAARIDVDSLFARQAAIDALTAIDISGNQSLRLYVENAATRSCTSWDDPALNGTNTIREGDIWNRSNGLRAWRDTEGQSWSKLSDFAWRDFAAGRQYIRRDGRWELMNDPAAKYTVRSGIEILPAGIEISGGKYVRVRSGGVFTVDSGNFAIDESGNVTLRGVIEALEGGRIANWSIASGLLTSGSGSGCVALDSNAEDVYALWAGAESAASAPFRVARDGTVWLTRLMSLDENGGAATVDLRSYPLWKLNYATVKSISVSGDTLTIATTSQTVNFSKPAADGILRLNGSGQAANFSAELMTNDLSALLKRVYGYLYLSDAVCTRNTRAVVGTSNGSGAVASLPLAPCWDAAAASVDVSAWDASYNASGVTVTVTLSSGQSFSHFFAD